MEYARQHARWLREHANQLRERNPEMAAEYEHDAEDLEDAVERRARDLSAQ